MEKYTLIITEKPDAAKRIALALDENEKPRKMEKNQMPYYLAKRDREIVVVPALGHLYTVAAEKTGRSQYPVFNYKWAPRYAAERGAGRCRLWLEAISKLSEDADAFVDACDYDIEGSIIGYNILKYACAGKEQIARRMKYSTLTKEDLEKAYAEMLPHLDFALIEAGLTRHEVDWLYGINLSRALTMAAKGYSGKYATLSTGRVQGPTLKFVVAREKTIKSFVPTPFWQILAGIEIDGKIFKAKYEKEVIETKREADDIVNKSSGKNGVVEKVATKQFEQAPPAPFDLGSLQSEAYYLFGYTPTRTSRIAQRLYLDALISYPRTSSQKLPPSINYDAILRNLGRAQEYRRFIEELLLKPKLKPREGQKEDPAHPAIYPTGKLPQRVLEYSERNIWDLVVRRFMAAFAESALRQTIRAIININGHRFYLTGTHTLRQGWLHFYERYTKSKEVILPQMQKGQPIHVKKMVLEDKFTNPLPRYNPSSLLTRMEKAEIGTKATRADTIQTLFSRKYVTDEKMIVTELGFEVISVLEEHCSNVISTKLTRELEDKMNNIQTNNEKRERVVSDTIETLRPVLERLRRKEKAIGSRLAEALRKSRTEERTVSTCPTCKTGKLTILYSRKSGKRFIGCTNYFKGICKTSFPLPQRGGIKPLSRSCRGCGWPTVQVIMKGRRPWTLCFNPQCPLKEERRKRN
jgi:DNA topoisomerase-1